MSTIVTYFFFDIDGTLLLSGGAGRRAMQQVMAEMFDVGDLPMLKVHGRTDRAIINDLFEALKLDLTPQIYTEFSNRYHNRLDACIGECEGSLLAGAEELLVRLSTWSGVNLGLLTGNSRHAAMTKVSHFGIDSHFSFGGYGSEHAERTAVAQAALDDCRRWAEPEYVDPIKAWVIGDTVSDVKCARSIGANAIAVATGGNSRQELEDSGADLVLDDLTNPQPILALCSRSGVARSSDDCYGS